MTIRARRTSRRIGALASALLLTAGVGCSDLLDDQQADAVVEIEAADQAELLRTRQEVLASAPTWSGTRVSEETTSAEQTALEFSLPGANLDIALGALGQLDAPVVATRIDVDPDQIDRTPTTLDDEGNGPAPSSRSVRLRVEVTEAAPAGAGAFLQLVMAIFSVIGMVSTVGWIMRWWRRRGERSLSPRRRIDRVDLREDPPTEETPRVPPQW